MVITRQDLTVPATDAVVFKYERPTEGLDKGKNVTVYTRTDRLVCAVQNVRKGGETNLHSHSHLDGVWFVLEGRAKFITTGGELIAEIGKHECVMVPRGYPYAFEAVGDEELVILQVEGSDVPFRTEKELYSDRVDYEPRSRAGNTSAGSMAEQVAAAGTSA